MANRYNLKIKVGSYTGDGTTPRKIDIGMPVKFVIIKRRIGTGVAVWGMPDLPNNTSSSIGSGAESNSGVFHTDESGFSITSSSNVNANGSVYDYVAMGGENTAIGAGSYMGTAVNPTTITDYRLNFTPRFLYIKGALAHTSRYRTSTMSQSGSFSTAGQAASNINTFLDGGFEIGGSANVNTAGAPYRFIALGGQPCYFYETTFTGNGTSQKITGLPFNPDFIIAKCNSTSNFVGLWFSTNPTETQFVTSTTPATDGITSASNNTIIIGANALCNENAVGVHLLCFKAGEYALPFERT